MDPKVIYWSAALANLAAVVVCAALGWRRARQREFAAHRRLMLTASWLVLAFLGSYVIKVIALGREQLELWGERYVRTLYVHEVLVTLMLICGIMALVMARRLGLPRGPASPPIEASRLARGVRRHRGAGRIAIVASAAGLATAAYVLWGMYARASG